MLSLNRFHVRPVLCLSSTKCGTSKSWRIRHVTDGNSKTPPPVLWTYRLAVAEGKMQQPDRPGPALDERADRRTLILTDDEISLPVPCLRAILGPKGAIVDGEHRSFESWVTPFGLLVSTPMIASGAQ